MDVVRSLVFLLSVSPLESWRRRCDLSLNSGSFFGLGWVRTSGISYGAKVASSLQIWLQFAGKLRYLLLLHFGFFHQSTGWIVNVTIREWRNSQSLMQIGIIFGSWHIDKDHVGKLIGQMIKNGLNGLAGPAPGCVKPDKDRFGRLTAHYALVVFQSFHLVNIGRQSACNLDLAILVLVDQSFHSCLKGRGWYAGGCRRSLFGKRSQERRWMWILRLWIGRRLRIGNSIALLWPSSAPYFANRCFFDKWFGSGHLQLKSLCEWGEGAG